MIGCLLVARLPCRFENQIEVLQAQGMTIAVACKEAWTTEQNYYRWRNEYVGLGVDQAKRLKQLET